MQITITGSQLELTEAMKQYAEKKIGGLEKYYDGITEAKVILGLETHHHNKGDIFFVECRLYVPGKDIFAKNTEKDLYAAIDKVRGELESELRKHKAKEKTQIKKQQIEVRESKEYKDTNDSDE
jgi:putative sigma-54 modulation protein